MRKSDRDKGQKEIGRDRENEKEERMYVAYASMCRECVIVRVCVLEVKNRQREI